MSTFQSFKEVDMDNPTSMSSERNNYDEPVRESDDISMDIDNTDLSSASPAGLQRQQEPSPPQSSEQVLFRLSQLSIRPRSAMEHPQGTSRPTETRAELSILAKPLPSACLDARVAHVQTILKDYLRELGLLEISTSCLFKTLDPFWLNVITPLQALALIKETVYYGLTTSVNRVVAFLGCLYRIKQGFEAVWELEEDDGGVEGDSEDWRNTLEMTATILRLTITARQAIRTLVPEADTTEQERRLDAEGNEVMRRRAGRTVMYQ